MMRIRREAEITPMMKAMMKKPITVLSVLIIAGLTISVALAGRLEQRAQQDRFSFGENIEYTGR
jgi:hypothetical protein